MQKYTNESGISLTMAVWLAHDSYDNDNTLSATKLIKPIKEVILADRIKPGEIVPDIQGLVASRMGTAIHNAVEDAWMDSFNVF